jgi:hypothetical protein
MARLIIIAGLMSLTAFSSTQAVPHPPGPEPIDIIELPLPPVVTSTETGACTKDINPNLTGCMNIDDFDFQAGDFTPDGEHIIVNVDFAGAPASPDPASIYSGMQLILVKTNGETFGNGDAWKCLTCGIPPENAVSIHPETNYPHVFRSGDKVLWGRNIVDCNGTKIQECDAGDAHIYPIYWPNKEDGSGPGGSPRELRLHPDDRHLAWSEFVGSNQWSYLGLLEFNPNPQAGDPLAVRFDLVNVHLLYNAEDPGFLQLEDREMRFNETAVVVGELRGFSGPGDEITYIGLSTESCNIDVYAVHIGTGRVRRITTHPEYVDPIAFSADDTSIVIMDTRGSDRQMFMAGMRGIPPVIDLVASTVAASTRNNGERRFFQPYLLDRYGDRLTGYFGQQVNAAGNGSSGAINDPNWNGRADPAFSLDSTRIGYYQKLVQSPACGGANPLPCPVSTAPGGRTCRLMVANLTSRSPTKPAPVFEVPEVIPWATPFPPGSIAPNRTKFPAGDYILRGRVSGFANVTLRENNMAIFGVDRVVVQYNGYADYEGWVIDGSEDVTQIIDSAQPWLSSLEWFSDLTQTGSITGTKKTSRDGFNVTIDALKNIFQANGTLATVLDGVEYRQPANNA